MMRIDYDQDHDTVYIRLHQTPRTAESDEVEPGVIVDYGPDGQVVGFELLDARRRGPWGEWVQVGGCAADTSNAFLITAYEGQICPAARRGPCCAVLGPAHAGWTQDAGRASSATSPLPLREAIAESLAASPRLRPVSEQLESAAIQQALAASRFGFEVTDAGYGFTVTQPLLRGFGPR